MAKIYHIPYKEHYIILPSTRATLGCYYVEGCSSNKTSMGLLLKLTEVFLDGD